MTWIGLTLFALCLASFAWGLAKFFIRPDGRTPALMQVLGMLGIIAPLIQGYLIAMHPADGLVRQIAGLAGFAGSLLLFWAAVRAARASATLAIAFSGASPRRLITAGPYRWIRHPFYTSYLLCWIASCLFTTSAAAWLVPLIMFAFYWHAASGEERVIAAGPLAAEYAAYRRRTGMFLPGL
jgi:protein-S-isoprenylcysteine O-methyltransferase Ste14